MITMKSALKDISVHENTPEQQSFVTIVFNNLMKSQMSYSRTGKRHAVLGLRHLRFMNQHIEGNNFENIETDTTDSKSDLPDWQPSANRLGSEAGHNLCEPPKAHL